MLGIKNRETLKTPEIDEFENLISQVRGFFLVEHNEDGTHRATSLLVPIGSIVVYAGTTAPAGWVLADGGQLSRTTYQPLFSTIGVTFGAGDGSTTFNVPNISGPIANTVYIIKV